MIKTTKPKQTNEKHTKNSLNLWSLFWLVNYLGTWGLPWNLVDTLLEKTEFSCASSYQ